jgi:hypothetical protein
MPGAVAFKAVHRRHWPPLQNEEKSLTIPRQRPKQLFRPVRSNPALPTILLERADGFLRVEANGVRPFHQLHYLEQLLAGLYIADVVLTAPEPLSKINLPQPGSLSLLDEKGPQNLVVWGGKGSRHPACLMQSRTGYRALANTEKISILARWSGTFAMNKKPPFSSQTGNPEAHDYLDWYRHLLRTGQIAEPSAKSEAAPPATPKLPEQKTPDTK